MLCAVAGIVVVTLLSKREPKYQGLSLSEWLKRYEDAEIGSPKEVEAVAAVLVIGTNRLPYLVDCIQQGPDWRDWLYENLPSAITDRQTVSNLLNGREIRADDAAHAFWVLGTNAASAIPKLESLLRDTRDKSVDKDSVIDALGCIGEPAVPILQTALADTNQTYQTQMRIVWEFVIMTRRADSNTYFSLILAALNHEDPNVRGAATNALDELTHTNMLVNVP